MSTKRASETEFLRAAHAVDDELEHFQRAVEAVQRGPLNSAKGLERAAQSLTQVTEAEQRLGAAMQALSGALNQAHALQQEQAQQAVERAKIIAVRTAEFQKLMEGYRALGTAATALNGETAELLRRKKELKEIRDPADRAETAALVGDVQALQAKLSGVAEVAQKLMETARATDFEDVARQADSVRQQLLAASNKLALFGRSLVA